MKTNKIFTIGLIAAATLITGCRDSFLEVEKSKWRTIGGILYH